MQDTVESRQPLTAVRPGDLVTVYAGTRIPIDGIVEAGTGTVNEAPITGESMPAFPQCREHGVCRHGPAGW